MVVQIEAARAAVADQAVGHVDQRRSFAPQVVGQQRVETPAGRIAVERAERSAERLLVECQRAHRVARGCHSRCGARREDDFRLAVAAVDVVRLEKLDRQVGNLPPGVHTVGLHADERQVFAVGRAFDRLAAEQFQCLVGSDVEYVARVGHGCKGSENREKIHRSPVGHRSAPEKRRQDNSIRLSWRSSLVFSACGSISCLSVQASCSSFCRRAWASSPLWRSPPGRWRSGAAEFRPAP